VAPDYIYNMERLLQKFATAARLVPQPVLRPAARPTRDGVIYFGSTSPAMDEALDVLAPRITLSMHCACALTRSRGRWPNSWLRTTGIRRRTEPRCADALLLVNELEVSPAKLLPVLHYDGTPITARFIVAAIQGAMVVGEIGKKEAA
jgi:2-oxoglutarate ferredoxin oxidoreductase subunit alpha